MSRLIASALQFALISLPLSANLVHAQSDALTEVEWRTGIARIDNLILQLTPEEKISLVHGARDPGNQQEAGYVVGVPRLGISPIRLTDGEA